jgi:transcriptional regulator with XRE-family HTH domain
MNRLPSNPPPLRMARLAAGVSQKELARMFGRGNMWISRIENGRRSTPLLESEAQKIADRLRRPVEELFQEAE